MLKSALAALLILLRSHRSNFFLIFAKLPRAFASGIDGKAISVFMNRNATRRRPLKRLVRVRQALLMCIAGLIAGAGTFGAVADTSRTQTIQLSRGWNAVFLEVFPAVSAPGVVFSNAPVSIVAAHFPLPNSVEFVTDPSRINWKKE